MEIDRFSKIRILGLTFLCLLIFLTISSTVGLFHVSPANTAGKPLHEINSTDKNITVDGVDRSLGLTYGERNTGFDEKPWSMFYGIPLVLPLLPFTALYIVIIWLIYSHRFNRPKSSKGSIQFSHAVILMVGSYLIFNIGTFALLPSVKYISSNHPNGASFLLPIGEIVPYFWILISFQALMFGLVVGIWTRPIIPRTLCHFETASTGKKKLTIHLENWRKLGSWIVTLVGGVVITFAIAMIGALPFGGFFIIHSILVSGGTLLLSLGYVIYKLHELEWVIGELEIL